MSKSLHLGIIDSPENILATVERQELANKRFITLEHLTQRPNVSSFHRGRVTGAHMSSLPALNPWTSSERLQPYSFPATAYSQQHSQRSDVCLGQDACQRAVHLIGRSLGISVRMQADV